MLERLWKNLIGEGRPTGAVKNDDRRAHPRHAIELETTCQAVSSASAVALSPKVALM